MSDYEIRDVNNRRLGPLLSLRMFGVKELGGTLGASWGPEVTQFYSNRVHNPQGVFDDFHLIIRVLNSGNGTAHAARFDVGIPVGINLHTPIETGFGWSTSPGQVSMLGNNIRVFVPPENCPFCSLMGEC